MTNAFLSHYVAPRPFSRVIKFRQYFALLLCAAFASSAVAQGTRGLVRAESSSLTYNDGDLFLGFRATDRTSDYLVNIGQPAQFVNAAPGATIEVAVGSTSADLAAAFGSDWYTRIDEDTGRNAVLWSVVGGRQIEASGDLANTLYSTKPVSNPWPSRSDTAQSFTTSLISALGNTFAGNNPSPNNPQGLIQNATSSNCYASFQPGGANSGGISFQTWNPSNDGGPASSLFFNRIAAGSCATVLGTFVLNSNGALGFTATLSPAPINLSGSISYCSNPGLPPVPGVTVTLTGAMSGSTVSNGSGAYTLSSLPSGGNYVVTPTKAALAPAANGIDGVDVLAVTRYFLGLGTPLSGCQLTAADANGDSSVTGVDSVAVQRFFLGFATGIANVGKYQFAPASRSYTGSFCDRTGQNFDGLVIGDAAGGFAHRPAGLSESLANDDGVSVGGEVPATVATLTLPEVTVDQFRSDFVAEVTTSAVDARNSLVGFQGDFTFDERVLTFESEPVQKAGLTAGNWTVAGHVLPGAGPIRTLRLLGYSNDFIPLSGEGTLFELRITRVSKATQGRQLLWAAPPHHFIFIDADLNTQKPGDAAPGSVAPSGARK